MTTNRQPGRSGKPLKNKRKRGRSNSGSIKGIRVVKKEKVYESLDKLLGKQFLVAVRKCDKSIPFIIITHGNCTDGSYSAHLAKEGLVGEGFTVSAVIYYFHNTDNLTKLGSIFKGKYVLYLDVTPTLKDYNLLTAEQIASLFIIDHHPQNWNSEDVVAVHNLFKRDYISHLTITDRSHCATTLVCLVFNQSLLQNELIHHINKFDNGFLDDPITKSVASYNKHMAGTLLCEDALKKPFASIVAEGRVFEENDKQLIKESIEKGIYYVAMSKKINKQLHIFETLVEDELLSTGVADEYYANDKNSKETIVVTRFYAKNGGTKFSFRSHDTKNPKPEQLFAVDVAKLVGGGGHVHMSAYFVNKPIDSFWDLLTLTK